MVKQVVGSKNGENHRSIMNPFLPSVVVLQVQMKKIDV